MKTQILIIFFLTAAITSHGQLHFSIDNSNPCVGQPVTFSLPAISGCSDPLVLSEADWSIYPTPDRVNYNFSAQNGVPGYTGVTMSYLSYQPTISVRAVYSCKGGPGGTISDLILMRPPLSSPTITGLADKIYSGDQSTAIVAAGNASDYSWKLSVVEVVSGSINEGAIDSPMSSQTTIDWPMDFVGTVDITATASAAGCADTNQTTKQVSVLTPPSAVFYESSVAPSAHCAGTLMRYRLEVFGGFTITQAQVIVSGGATDVSVFNTRNGVPVEWSVKWISQGEIRVRYSLSDGTRSWVDRITPTISFDVLQLDAGQLRPIPLASVCAPIDVTLSLDRQPTGGLFVFQYCNTGDCSVASADWIDNPAASPEFKGISTNTSFRVKLTDYRCGTFQSSPVTISVKPTPSITTSNKYTFSGGTFEIPSADLLFSTVTVKATATGVSGASDIVLLQGSSIGTLATQTLVANGRSDGIVTYAVTPSKDQCIGETKHATVIVYPRPQIETDRPYIYKGVKTTLRTGDYESYLWQTQAGEILGSGRIYEVATPNNYIVTVTKNGAEATSDPIFIGGQFSGVNENYIVTRQPLRELTSAADLESLSENDVSESILYIDGLGRPKQKIDIRMSPSAHDIVQPIAYDRYGREVQKFLPYVSSASDGRIRPNAITTEQPAFYQQDDPTIPSDLKPYSETVFEDSPLNRVLKQGAAGSPWQPNADPDTREHVVRHQYTLNTSADSVMRLGYDYQNETIALMQDGQSFYPGGVLYKTLTFDEDNKEMIEFTDKLNRTVCKKVHAGGNIYACTYYVYDDLGNLVTVIPPEGVKALLH